MRSNLLAIACVWGAVACDGPGSSKPGKEPLAEPVRPPAPSRQPPTSPDTAAPPPASGPDAPATITQKRWLQMQLDVAIIDSPSFHHPARADHISATVSPNAIELSYSRTTDLQLTLEESKRFFTWEACSILTSVDIPTWVTEFHLHVGVDRQAEEYLYARSRVARSKLKLPCDFAPRLDWSRPVTHRYLAPDFSGIPLSTVGREELPSGQRRRPRGEP